MSRTRLFLLIPQSYCSKYKILFPYVTITLRKMTLYDYKMKELRIIFKEVMFPVGDIKIEKVANRVGQWSPVRPLAEAVNCK